MKDPRNEREAHAAQTPAALSPTVYRGPLRPQRRVPPSLWRRLLNLLLG